MAQRHVGKQLVVPLKVKQSCLGSCNSTRRYLPGRPENSPMETCTRVLRAALLTVAPKRKIPNAHQRAHGQACGVCPQAVTRAGAAGCRLKGAGFLSGVMSRALKLVVVMDVPLDAVEVTAQSPEVGDRGGM